jgi:hypothetical protein
VCCQPWPWAHACTDVPTPQKANVVPETSTHLADSCASWCLLQAQEQAQGGHMQQAANA